MLEKVALTEESLAQIKRHQEVSLDRLRKLIELHSPVSILCNEMFMFLRDQARLDTDFLDRVKEYFSIKNNYTYVQYDPRAVANMRALNPEFMDSGDVSIVLSISRSTATKWMASGKCGFAKKVGGKWYVTRAQLKDAFTGRVKAV